MKREIKSCDVAVIGAGSAGISAAISAANSGKTVILVERDTVLGGLASAAMVGTVCGLFYRNKQKARYATQGFATQFAKALAKASQTKPCCFAEGLHFLPYKISAFHQLSLHLLQQAGVKIYLKSSLLAVEMRDKQITQLVIKKPQHELIIQPLAAVDCSGQAHVSIVANLPYLTEPAYQSASFVFQVAGLPKMEARMLRLNLIRWLKMGISQGDLDPDCAYLSLIIDTVNQGQGLFKLGLPCPTNEIERYLEIYQELAKNRSIEIVDYLKKSQPLLSTLHIIKMASKIGIRNSARSKGVELLTEQQVLACAKPNNGIAVGVWAIEYWQERKKPTMQYFPENDSYWIPAGALVSESVSNLFFAGRTFSATEQAMASARVIGTCLSTGYAAGMLASEWINSGRWQFAVDKIQLKQVITQV